MLSAERRQKILNILEREGKVTVASLASRLSISVDTIRRDLKELEVTHQLTRVHGGALPRSPAHIPYATRQTQNVRGKKALAKLAVDFIQPHQLVFIDGGSTALEVAKSIPFDLEATVVTVCPFVLVTLSQHPHIKTIMPGGMLNKSSMTVVGGATNDALQRVHADVCILGVCSLHLNAGITAHDYEEAQVKINMIQNSAQVIAVTASEKLGTVAPFVVANIDTLSHIVTDDAISDEQVTLYTELGIEIIKPS